MKALWTNLLALGLSLSTPACAEAGASGDATTGAIASGDTTCAAHTAATELHVDFADGTALDASGCFAARPPIGAVTGDAGGAFWNNMRLGVVLTSPDGATSLRVVLTDYDSATLATGADITVPAPHQQMQLSLAAHGANANVDANQTGSEGTFHFDEWQRPTQFESDGRLSVTLTAKLSSGGGGGGGGGGTTTLRIKVTGLVIESFLI
jgi:hypothetical protein